MSSPARNRLTNSESGNLTRIHYRSSRKPRISSRRHSTSSCRRSTRLHGISSRHQFSLSHHHRTTYRRLSHHHRPSHHRRSHRRLSHHHRPSHHRPSRHPASIADRFLRSTASFGALGLDVGLPRQ